MTTDCARGCGEQVAIRIDSIYGVARQQSKYQDVCTNCLTLDEKIDIITIMAGIKSNFAIKTKNHDRN